MAAYWLERDAIGLPENEVTSFVERCRRAASRYDLHIYFPDGLIPFESDGYRSGVSDFHKRVAERIQRLLDEWGLEVVCLDMVDLATRADVVVSTLWPPQGGQLADPKWNNLSK